MREGARAGAPMGRGGPIRGFAAMQGGAIPAAIQGLQDRREKDLSWPEMPESHPWEADRYGGRHFDRKPRDASGAAMAHQGGQTGDAA